ncbi:MAG: hypothetical protein ACXADY_23085 [Candidatus Hodarchaeales archaeon]|jgi:hypothetical protein
MWRKLVCITGILFILFGCNDDTYWPKPSMVIYRVDACVDGVTTTDIGEVLYIEPDVNRMTITLQVDSNVNIAMVKWNIVNQHNETMVTVGRHFTPTLKAGIWSIPLRIDRYGSPLSYDMFTIQAWVEGNNQYSDYVSIDVFVERS